MLIETLPSIIFNYLMNLETTSTYHINPNTAPTQIYSNLMNHTTNPIFTPYSAHPMLIKMASLHYMSNQNRLHSNITTIFSLPSPIPKRNISLQQVINGVAIKSY
eukprot:1101154_1